MKIRQFEFTPEAGWNATKTPGDESVNLVLAFGSREILSDPQRYQDLRTFFPAADIVMTTSSGNIQGQNVSDQSLVVSALTFEKTKTKCVNVSNLHRELSNESGKKVIELLENEDLRHVLVFSEGNKVNGSELVNGLASSANVSVTGGLAGDAARFEKTLVGLNEPPMEGNIVGIGFYGDHLVVGHGSLGGWDLFGPEREVTKSNGNVLYEIDGKSALDLYKNYLGEKANELPGAALLFPLGMKAEGENELIVRTILSIDETNNAMIFAGDLPEGSVVRFMKANFEKLIEGAADAASQTMETLSKHTNPEFALLISCVGRKLVLDQRVEEEVEAVQEILGDSVHMTGFYSYGEISPFITTGACTLHNQTMTITTFSEN